MWIIEMWTGQFLQDMDGDEIMGTEWGWEKSMRTAWDGKNLWYVVYCDGLDMF